MQIIPAIDIKDGVCVRATGVDLDPVSQASDFIELGAKYLHIVDLNAALGGAPVNFNQIRHIISLPDVHIEVSAGIKTAEDIQKYFALKPRPWQIILSSRALFDLPFIKTSLNRFGNEHLTISLDYNEDKVAARGWKDTSPLTLEKIIPQLNKLNIKRYIITDVTKDGTSAGIDLNKVSYFKENLQGEIVVSGGVSALKEVKALQKIDIAGVVIGKALYEGTIDLDDVLSLNI